MQDISYGFGDHMDGYDDTMGSSIMRSQPHHHNPSGGGAGGYGGGGNRMRGGGGNPRHSNQGGHKPRGGRGGRGMMPRIPSHGHGGGRAQMGGYHPF